MQDFLLKTPFIFSYIGKFQDSNFKNLIKHTLIIGIEKVYKK